MPSVMTDIIDSLARCMVPLGLLMTGVNLAQYIREPRHLFEPRIIFAASLLRLGVLPLVMLAGGTLGAVPD